MPLCCWKGQCYPSRAHPRLTRELTGSDLGDIGILFTANGPGWPVHDDRRLFARPVGTRLLGIALSVMGAMSLIVPTPRIDHLSGLATDAGFTHGPATNSGDGSSSPLAH